MKHNPFMLATGTKLNFGSWDIILPSGKDL
jgi:hypothetical protein